MALKKDKDIEAAAEAPSKKSLKDIEAAAEAPSKKSLKDLIGPVAVTPSITKQSSVDGTTKIDNEGAGVRVGTKYGNINISKNKIHKLILKIHLEKVTPLNIKVYLMIKNLKLEKILS
jgi:membrane protein involved in colicin uptake